MKIHRFLLATAIVLAVAACSTDVTAPDPSVRATGSAASLEESSTSATSTAQPAAAEEEDDGGLVGSGVGR